MNNSEIFERIIDNKLQIIEALSSGASSGLLVLFRLYDFKGNLTNQLGSIEKLLQELSKEQLYYDLVMIKELVDFDKDQFIKGDLEDFICLFFDKAVYSFDAIDEISEIEKIQSKILKIKESKNNFFFDVFCLRISLICFDAMGPYRLHLRESLKVCLIGIKKFPLNFFKVFKAGGTFKKLMKLLTALESIGSGQSVKNEKQSTVIAMRQTAIEVVNSDLKAAGISRYLYSLINPYTSDMDELRKQSAKDQKLLDTNKKNEMGIAAALLIVGLVFSGPNLVDNYHTWFMSSEGQRGQVLTVKAVNNAALGSKLTVGDKISRINDIINPSLEELRQEIANSPGELTITKSREGNFKTINVNPLVDGSGNKKLGVSFFVLSDGRKVFTVLVSFWLLYLFIELGKYIFRFIDVLSYNFIYTLNLLMLVSFCVFYDLLLKILGFNIHTFLVLFGIVFGTKHIIGDRWILKGWLDEIGAIFKRKM